MNFSERIEADQKAFDQLSWQRQLSVKGVEQRLGRRLSAAEFGHFEAIERNGEIAVLLGGPLVAEIITRRADGYVDPATGGWVVRAPEPTMA